MRRRRLRLSSGRGSSSRRSTLRWDRYAESITWCLGTSNPLGQFQLFWLHGILSPLSSLICIWPRFEHHCLLLSPQHTPYSIAHPEISIPNQLSGIADRATESCLSVCSFPLEFSSHYEKTSYLPIVELPREVDRFRQTLEGTREIHFLGNKSSVLERKSIRSGGMLLRDRIRTQLLLTGSPD